LKLLLLCSFWVSGIVLGSLFSIPAPLLIFAFSPLTLLFFKSLRSRALLAVLCLFLFIAGALHYENSLPGNCPQTLAYHNESQVLNLRGFITGEVKKRDRTQHLRVTAEEIRVEGVNYQTGGDVLIYAPRYSEYSYGDEVLVAGVLEDPPVFRDEDTGEVEFDYADYLSLQDVHSVMLYPDIEVLSSGNGNAFLSGLYIFKDWLGLSLARALPEPQASLSQGVLLGMRDSIPDDVRESFSHTGTYHLLAISGLHLGIIATLTLSVSRSLTGRRYYLYVWLALMVVWLYAIISGANPPVIRAAIMTSTFLAAELTGRQKNALPALGLAAAVMVAVDPRVVFTASFQMSFAAMTGIILFYPVIRSWGSGLIGKGPPRLNRLTGVMKVVNDGLAVSLSATLFVAPLIVYYFGIFSPIGPVVTLLALPGLVALIISSSLIAVVGLWWPAAAGFAGWFGWFFSSYMIYVIETAANFKFAYFENVKFPPLAIICYYPFLLLAGRVASRLGPVKNRLLFKIKGSNPEQQTGSASPVTIFVMALLFLLMLLFAFNPLACRQGENIQIDFLDVGQGDAILLSYQNQQVLVDGGPSPEALMNELGSIMPFWDRTIEMVVLTHAHSDHINGLIEVLRRYEVGHVIYPDTSFFESGYDLRAFEKWLKLIEEQNIPATIAKPGQYFHLGNTVITVLSPPVEMLEGTHSDVDNNSVVLNVQAGKHDFILTGDLMWQGELELVLNRLIEPATLLKAGHHGSRTSSSTEFLAIVKPGLSVICVGENNYGHPHPEALWRLGEVMDDGNIHRTDKQGRVTFITDGQKLWLKE